MFVTVALLSYICTPELIVVSVMSDKTSILAMLYVKFTFHGTEWQFYQYLHHEIQMQSDLSCGGEPYSTKELLLLEVERQRQCYHDRWALHLRLYKDIHSGPDIPFVELPWESNSDSDESNDDYLYY